MASHTVFMTIKHSSRASQTQQTQLCAEAIGPPTICGCYS